MNLLLPLLLLTCLGAELKFNIGLSDEELILAQVMKAQNKEIAFQWGVTTVDLELWSESGLLEPTQCAHSACQLKYDTFDLKFKNQTIPDLQKLLERTTLSLSVEQTEVRVQILVLLKWHEPEIIDGVDYGTTLTIFAKQISVGFDSPESSSTHEVKDALVVRNKSIHSLEKDCNLKLLSVAEGQPYINVEGINRNGTCSFGDIDYYGPAILGNVNILFEEPAKIQKCSSQILEVKQNGSTYDARLLSNDDHCVSLKHQNSKFPTLWFEKPKTECDHDEITCKFVFREIQSDQKTLMHDGKPVPMLSQAKPIAIVNGPFIIQAGQAQITVALSASVRGIPLCEYIAIDSGRSYDRIAIGADKDQITCDLSDLDLYEDFALRVKGDDYRTSPVMVIILAKDITEDHYVVYYSSEEFYPQQITLRSPVPFKFSGQCVYQSGTLIEVTSDLKWKDNKTVECSIDSGVFKTGATSYDIIIRLADGQRIANNRRLWLQQAVNLQLQDGIPTRIKLPLFWQGLINQLHLQDINTLELIPSIDVTGTYIQFDTCPISRDLKLVSIISGEIIPLSTNVITSEPCPKNANEVELSYYTPTISSFLKVERQAFSKTLEKDVFIDVGLPLSIPKIVPKSQSIKLLPISFEAESMLMIKGNGCINRISLTQATLNAVLLNIESKVLCTIESSRSGKTTAIYQSTLRDGTCDTICVSIRPQDDVNFYLYTSHQISERLSLQLLDELVIESLEPQNVIMVSGLDTAHAFKLTGKFPSDGKLDLILSDSDIEYFRTTIQAPITTLYILQRDLKPGLTNLQLASIMADLKSNIFSLFVQEIVFETQQKVYNVIANSDKPVKIPFLKMAQLFQFVCYYKAEKQMEREAAFIDDGVYYCQKSLVGQWTVSAGLEGQETYKQIATINSVVIEVQDVSPRLILFNTQKLIISLKFPIPESALYCQIDGEEPKTSVRFIENHLECNVPLTSTTGFKSLHLTTDFSSITLCQIQVAHFNLTSIDTVPLFLETQRTDQFLIIDFQNTFGDLDLVVQHGQTRSRALLIGTSYQLKLPQLLDTGLLTFDFYLCQPFAGLDKSVSLGLSIIKQVVPSPSVTFQTVHLMQSDKISLLRIQGDKLFNELQLACLFDEGLTRSAARVTAQNMICDFKPSMEGKHRLEVFSGALNRFINRSGWVSVDKRPTIIDATQLVLYDQDGAVLMPVIVQLDMGIFRKIHMDLVSEEGDRFFCPCKGEFKTLSCECLRAPRYSVYKIGLKMDSEHILFENQLRFLKIPQIIDTIPRVLGPLSEQQSITIMLDDDGLELVRGITWNQGQITSTNLTWITSKHLEVPVPVTSGNILFCQLQILGGFISEPFLIPISGHFTVSQIQFGSIPDESCLLADKCIFNMRLNDASKVLQRNRDDATVIKIKGSQFQAPINCLFKTDGYLVKVKAYLISNDTLICVVPQAFIDQLAPSTMLSIGIGLQDSDYQVYFRDTITVIEQPQLSRILPERIYGRVVNGAMVSSPITLTITGLWTPLSKMMIKISIYNFLATFDPSNAANVMRVDLEAIELPQQAQSQIKICVQISADGQNFTENQSNINAPCILTVIQQPEFLSIQFTSDTGRLKAIVQHVPSDFWMAWRVPAGQWSQITDYAYTKTQITILEVEFDAPHDDAIEFGISTVEGQYIVCPLMLAALKQPYAELPRHQVLIQKNDLELVKRASFLDFSGSVATTQVLVAAPSNFASIVKIRIFNSIAQLDAIKDLLSSSMDFVFTADGVIINKDFSFLQVDSKVYVQLQIEPTKQSIGQKPNLFVQATALVNDQQRLMSPLIQTGVQLDFTEALVIRPVPAHVVIGTERTYEVAIEGTGLHFLANASCNGKNALGVVMVKDDQARCLFKMMVIEDTSLKFEPALLVDGQDVLRVEALPAYNIRVLKEAPIIKSVEKQENLLQIKGDFAITDIASQVSCVFFGYNPTEQLWHELSTIQGHPTPTHIECPIPSQLTQSCEDLSIRLDFYLRQGIILSNRFLLPSELQLGSAYQQLKIKSSQQRLIRGDFAIGDISTQVGQIELELESQPCLVRPIPPLICVYSAGESSYTTIATLEWPIASCPVVYLGRDSVDLSLQFDQVEATQSSLRRDAIRFDQGSLKVITFGPTSKLGSKRTTFVFQLSEPFEVLECQFISTSETITVKASVQNRIAKCTCPPIRDDQLAVVIRADGERLPFSDQTYERSVPVIHVEYDLMRNEFLRVRSQKVRMRGKLEVFEFCVFMAEKGTNHYQSDLINQGESQWECEIPIELSRKLESALVSLQPFDSEELTEGIPISFTAELQISHAYYDEAGSLSFQLTGKPESLSCLLQTNAGGITIPVALKNDVYVCQQISNEALSAFEFQARYYLPGDPKPYTTAKVFLSYDLEQINQSYSFIRTSLGMNLFRSRGHTPPALCKYYVDGTIQYSQLTKSMPEIWVNTQQLTADMTFVCEQLAPSGQLINIQTATEIIKFSSSITYPPVVVKEHRKQIQNPGHLKVLLRTDFEGLCSLRSCLQKNIFNKLISYDSTTKVCEIIDPCVEIGEEWMMVSDEGLIWQTVKVPVLVRSNTKVLTWWPAVIYDGEQTFVLYGSDFRSDLNLQVQGRIVDYKLISTREITFSIKLDADQYAPDERLCEAQGQQSCMGPQFEVPYEFIQANPVTRADKVLVNGTIQLRIKQNLVISIPTQSLSPAFTVQPTVAICGVKTMLKLNFTEPVTGQLSFKNQPVIMDTEHEGKIQFYESCKASNFTSTEIRLGDQTERLTITKEFKLTLLQDELFRPINDAPFFRILMQSMKDRLSCQVGSVRGSVEITQIKDVYRCKIDTPIKELSLLVDDVIVALSTGHNNALYAFDQAVVQISITEYQLGQHSALEAKLYLTSWLDATPQYTCAYKSLLDGFSYVITVTIQDDKLICDLPDRNLTQNYELELTARIGLDTKVIWTQEVLIKARPSIVLYPEVVFEGRSLTFMISHHIDIELTCFGQQNSSRLRRAPAIKVDDDTYSCDLKLLAGYSLVYLGIESTPFSQNKVEIRMIQKPQNLVVKPSQLYIGPKSPKKVNLKIEGQISSLMDLTVSIDLVSSEHKTVLTINDAIMNISIQATYIMIVIPDIHQVPIGKFELVVIGTISRVTEELARVPFEVLQQIELEYSPQIICTGLIPQPVMLKFKYSDTKASHCMLTSDDKTTKMMLIEACEVQFPFRQVTLGRLIVDEFLSMTETKTIIYRGPVSIQKAYVATGWIRVEGVGLMHAFKTNNNVYCEVQSRPSTQFIAGQSTIEEISKYRLIVFIVNDQVAECQLPPSIRPNTYLVRLSSDSNIHLQTNQIQFILGIPLQKKALTMRWEVWMSDNTRQNALLSEISKVQAQASSPYELVIMKTSKVIFSFELVQETSSIQCRILRIADNQMYEAANRLETFKFSNWVSCPPFTIGHESEFFAGSQTYTIMVSFDGISYEALFDPIRISVIQPMTQKPIILIPDIYQDPTKSDATISYSQAADKCSIYKKEPGEQTKEWDFYTAGYPILALDQITQRVNATSAYYKKLPMCQVQAPISDQETSLSQAVMVAKASEVGGEPKLTVYVQNDKDFVEFVYDVPTILQPFKFTNFLNGNKTDGLFNDAYTFYNLPSKTFSTQPLKSLIFPPTFKLYKPQPIIIHQTRSPFLIFEDQVTLSDQTLQSQLLSVTLVGKNFTPDMTCILSSQQGQVYLTSLLFYEGPGLVRCSLQSLVEEQFKQESKALIRLTSNESKSYLKGLDGMVSDDPLEIVFKPRLAIRLKDPSQEFYLGNLDQAVKLTLSYSPISAQCEFKSIYYTTRTDLTSSNECPIPQLSGQDSSTIELSVRQQFTVMTANGPIIQYSLSNKLHLKFSRLPKITSINPLEVPAMAGYDQVVNVYGSDFKVGSHIVLRPQIKSDHFQSQSSFIRQSMPRIDSQWIVIRDFTVLSSSHGSFKAPKKMLDGIYSVQIATDDSISDDQIALNFIKLPEITRLMPSSVPQIAVSDIVGPDQGHLVVLEGRNFTQYSECVVQSFVLTSGLTPLAKDTLVPTVWISPEYLQCTIIPQQFAPFSYSGNKVTIRVLERSLYLNFETGFDLEFTNQPYVWKVEPNQAYLGHPNTPIRVYVSNYLTDQDLAEQFLFCNFGDQDISKVTKVERVTADEKVCSKPDFFDSGQSSHLLLPDECLTTMTILHCMTPSTRKRVGYSTKVEILNSQGEFTHTVLGRNSFQFLAAPVMHGIFPQVLPIVDLTIQPITDKAKLTITGENFVNVSTYQCLFKKGSFSQNPKYMSPAIFISTSQLQCDLPYVESYPIGLTDPAFITVELQSQTLLIKGVGLIKLFKQPIITNYWPKIGQLSGGTIVTISGKNFDPSLGGIVCRFGGTQVEASVFTIGKMIQCRSPQSTTVGSVILSVSVDGGFTFFNMIDRDGTVIQSKYVYVSLQVASIQKKSQDYWGQLDIIINTNLPYTSLLELAQNFGLPQVDVKCRYDFSNTDRIETVGHVSETSITCPIDRHLVTDHQIVMAVSFNNQDFVPVALNVALLSEVFSYETIPLKTVASQDLYSHIMSLQYFQGYCPDIYQLPSKPFHTTISPLWDNDLNIFVRIDTSIQTIPCKSRVEFQNSLKEFPPEKVTTGYEYEFTVDSLLFRFYYKNQNQPVTDIYERLYGLYQWLCTQSSAIMLCQQRTKEFMISIKPYYDPTQITTETRLSCKVGSYNFQQYIAKDEVMLVECMVNLSGYVPTPSPIEIAYSFDSLTPKFAFIDELNVTLTLVVNPLYEIDSLRCRLNDVPLIGNYAVIKGKKSIQCVVPSVTYLKALSQQPPADGVWLVTVSLDGITYSQQAYSFKYIESEQIKSLSVMIGPETGGTIITLQVRDLAPVDLNDLPIVSFKFPGHETDGQQSVNGVYVGLNTINCKVPPLKASDIDTDLIVSSKMFTTVRVQLEVLGYRIKEYFTFTYLKGVAINRLDPPNYAFESQSLAPSSRPVKIIGQHFIPVEDQLYCRVGFTQPVIIQAQYRFNNTVECEIPPPPVGYQLPLVVPIELSFNQGQQFTTSNVMFHYTPQDKATKIYPTRQYVKGNKIVKVFTSYFFDKAATTAKCKFTYNAQEYVANVVGYDAQGVMCFHPPAYLLSPSLAIEGGQTLVTVSANGFDYSTDSAQVFTYKKEVKITQVHPPFVLMDQQVVVNLIGENFYSVDDTNLLRVRLTRIVTDPSMTPLSFVVASPMPKFVDSKLVTFIFPSGVFSDKDFVSIELTFDEITWDTAQNSRVVVYKQIVLTKIRPSFVYTGSTEREVVLQAQPFFNNQGIQQKGGSIWEMEQFGWLKCRFNSQLDAIADQSTLGRFFNATHVGCPLPVYTVPEQIMVDLTIDNGVTFSANKVGIQLINEPEIVGMNNTEYFYTYNERVFIQLTGTNFDKSDKLYVKIGDQVQIIPKVKFQSQSVVVFEMPYQLNLGSYLITVSTDGLTYRPRPSELTQFRVSVLKCPNGYTCKQKTATICPQGFFCPFDQLQVHQKRECRLGTYMTGEGATECLPCSAGKFCPNIRLYVEQACPIGFICNNKSQHSVAQLIECPAGYICKPDVTQKIDPENLFSDLNMKPCPLGHYCPKGTIEYAMISHYGNYTTPQLCRDGVICAQNVEEVQTKNQPGALNQFGIEVCPVGFYCQKGRKSKCPKGYQCPSLGAYEPAPCPPGYFQSNTTQTSCEQCPIGTFCFFAKMSKPIKCTPGWVCQMKAGMAPAQLCPAGSFCNLATVTNQTNSTVEQLFKPNFCYQSSYCLAGVYTPFVNQSNQQAAQSCIAGTFCAEGSASPEGKGKCKEGFYCPANSVEMIPTDPGYFAQGTGNVAPEKCRPGTYQDMPQQRDCIQCPIGYFCPDQMMTGPKICGAGDYSTNEGSTQCSKCPLGTFSDQIGVSNEESCFQCEPRFLCTTTGLTTMRDSQPCIEGHYCWYGTTNTIMLNSKVASGYYGGYNITGIAEFNLCLEGKYCPAGTAFSKVKQLDCLRGFFCPIGTMADLDLNGNFKPGVKQVDRNILINALKGYLAQTIKYSSAFKQNITENRLDKQLNFYRANKEKYIAEYNRLEWEFYKYELNLTIIAERQKYLEDVLLTDIRCEEDKTLPEPLIQAYIKNGTNLLCPKGTESDRGSWCIGQCKINLASKEPLSILNPVRDIIGITSLSNKDETMSIRFSELGSEFKRENPDWDNEKAKRDKDSLFGQSPWAKGSRLNPYRQLNQSDLGPHDQHRLLKEEQIAFSSRQTQRNLQLNSQNRNYDIVGGGVFDTIHVQTLKPLEIARLNFNLTVLPDKLLYNDHFEIKVLDQDDIPYKLPVYFSVENNKVTNKRALLQIRIFNWTEKDQVFKVALYLYHALFIPYLEIMSDKMWVEVYNAERQTRGTNMTHGVIITEQQFEGITLPYNTPDYRNDPSLWFDFVTTNQLDEQGKAIPEEFRVNPTTKGLDKDIFDPTYWQSKQINAVIMPWLPFFSNCDGFDSRIIIYDAFEYARNCTLEDYDKIRIVNPLPTQGLSPTADSCTLDVTCRYDEQLGVSNSMTTRWFQIREEKTLGYITRAPIPIENFWKIEDSDVYQTFYNSLIEDGSDEIVFINFIPTDTSGERIPRLVEVDFLYYQKTIDVKVVQSVKVYLKEYDEPLQPGQVPEVGYRLKINYKPLNFLNLINTFQFAFPIYILLFNLVALILILSVLTFWLFVLLFTRTRKPPALRFKHLAKVIFTAPAVGTLLSCLPVFMAAVVIILYTRSTLFHNLNSNWINMGVTVSAREIIQQQRGRAGMMLVIIGFVFLHYGSQNIVYKPSEEEEEEILAHQHKLRKMERIDLSVDDKAEAILADDEKEKKEENMNIRNALDWKRRHFFVTCIFVTCFLMLKIEFSYSKIFSKNITYFLTGFMALDIITEQILVRRVMSEALLVAPMLGTFAVCEFVMTMGAQDFRSFIISYFISFAVTTMDRIFIGPFVEKLEAWTQRVIIHLAKRSNFVKRIFQDTLIKQLAAQLQLMSLNEYNDRRIRNEDKKEVIKKRKFYDWQLEKGEGAEALLGTMMTYTTQTQALFLIPETLLLIIFLANETKIPLKYTIRKSDLTYYFIFTAVIILPNLIIDIFVLHIIEIIQGYKIFDYFTYCDYRYNVRTKKWLSGRRMDKSLNHHMRSLDSLMFSSQYYYIINLCTWSIIFMYLGVTAVNRNLYNPFADPILVPVMVCFSFAAVPLKWLLAFISDKAKLWAPRKDHSQRIDVSLFNRLDAANNQRRIINNIQTNPFRHKFIMVNREWLVSNIADVLGGRTYLTEAGAEMDYLKHIYQTAINTQNLKKQMEAQQKKLASKLEMLPYNQKKGDVSVSDDRLSDEPFNDWDLPQSLAQPYVLRLARMWIDFARQQIRLKFMVADIVQSKLKNRCQKCKERFRLQVIQKFNFTTLTRKFMEANFGIPFSQPRWRRFFARRQLFTTLCMECAYIDNLQAGGLREENPKLQEFLAEHAYRLLDQNEELVRKKLKLPHVRRVIYKWLQMSRASLLHKEKSASPSEKEQSKTDSTLDFF